MRQSIISTVILALLVCNSLVAQEIAAGVYWLSFTDKSDNGFSYSQPEAFLSQRSVDRRAWQGLGVDESDEPVTSAYVDSLRSMGLEIKHVSRWLNGVVLVNTPRYKYEEALALDFVDTLWWEPETDGIYFPEKPSGQRFSASATGGEALRYGYAANQIRQLDLEALHVEGYTGEGVWIGILDAGFRNVDSLPAFQSMITGGRLLGSRNFVSDTSVFRLVNSHGMSVLSAAGGLWEGQVVGTAPHGSFYLCSTENIWEETRLEEIAWIEAAEFLDSLGVDVFNTSLGYSDFDGEAYDHSYADMDGQSTHISRASSMLARKGILSCTSAGNEGNSSWYRITAPADAYDILAVAAVDSLGKITSFSSRGPTYDGRLNPSVAAQGLYTALQHGTGVTALGSGTSFSSPLMAGAAACLWQAFPETPAREMVMKIRLSGHLALQPDGAYGYGIPSFRQAFWPAAMPAARQADELNVYPNPATDFIHVDLADAGAETYLIRVFDISGRMVYGLEQSLPARIGLPAALNSGLYLLELSGQGLKIRTRFIRQ